MLRIAHVLTYVSEDGSFGGPLAVAVAQTAALAARGHEVHLHFGWDGKANIQVPGVSLHPHHTQRLAGGFSGLWTPRLASGLVSDPSPDIVHVHYGRDLVTAPAAAATQRKGIPTVLQPHGMIAPDNRLRAKVFDAVWTRRTLSAAKMVLVLGSLEARTVASVSPCENLVQIPNGVPASADPSIARDDTVVFIARLHPRKRVLDFIDAAHLLVEAGYQGKFEIYGPDEGDLARGLERIASGAGRDRISYCGSLPPGGSQSVLRRSRVFVLPSRGEVFPMTVLESMSARCPVVISDDSEISRELDEERCAVVYSGGAADLAKAIKKLLDDSTLADDVASSAYAKVASDWSIGAVAARLEDIYLSLITR